jgi:hypothetical protein
MRVCNGLAFCRVADMKDAGIEIFPWENRETPDGLDAAGNEREPHVFRDVTLGMEAVMARLQGLFTGRLQWFHPTPTGIVAGDTREGFFMTVQGRNATMTTLEVSVRLVRGNPQVFDEWLRKMESFLQTSAPVPESVDMG